MSFPSLSRTLSFAITVCFLLILFPSERAWAQEANFDQAQQFTTDRMEDKIGDLQVSPNWIEDENQLWYEFKTPAGNRWHYVDADDELQRPLFDHESMAAELNEILEEPVDRYDLPLEDFDYDTDEERFTFHVDSLEFSYDVEGDELVKGDTLEPENGEDWAAYSPDSTWIAFAREHDLYLMEADDPDSTEHRLTEDGERWYSFQEDHSDTTSSERLPTNAEWFEDSEKLYVKRQDWRDVDELWVVDALAEPRPELDEYKYAMPGEEDIYRDELLIFDVDDQERVELDVDKWPDQSLGGVYFNEGGIFTTDESDHIYFLRRDRTWEHIDVCRGDTETGEVEVLWSETSRPYFNTRYLDLAIINEGEEYIWWSERDGWGQLYRYDSDGNLQNRVTDGYYNAGDIAKIDTTGRTIYYEGFAKEDDEHPYQSTYYRVDFDGSDHERVTPHDAHHTFEMADTKEYFVSTRSRADQPPVTTLRDDEGALVLELEEADMSPLRDIGWEAPERFTVKAADGITDLYGVMWKPFDFDPEEEYPIISYVYPGPQVEPFPVGFSLDQQQTLAQLGFVVVAMGQRGGSPIRHKHYHTYGHGDLRDYPLPDNKHGLEQLADRYGYIDLDRVGIYGHSGGAFMSTAALLTYPDFYDVAVSSAGNHDNNIYNIWWSEVHHGVEEKTRTVTEEDEDGNEEEVEETHFEVEGSEIPSNTELAENLEGHLLLVTGDIDSNVHPANTYRMAHALIEEGKSFDFMLFPGMEHGFDAYSDYFERMTWRYFADHLLDDRRTDADFDLPDDWMEED